MANYKLMPMVISRSILFIIMLGIVYEAQAQCKSILINPNDSLAYTDSSFKTLLNCTFFMPSYSEISGGTEFVFVNGKIIKERGIYENGTIQYVMNIDTLGRISDDSIVYNTKDGLIQKIDYYKNGNVHEFKYYSFSHGINRLNEEQKKLNSNCYLRNEYKYLTDSVIGSQTLITSDSCFYIFSTPSTNNKIVKIESYKKKLRDGMYVGFNQNGTPYLIETYVEGLKNGWCFYYNETGEFLRCDLYNNDMLIQSKSK